jgi:hypothetical protein
MMEIREADLTAIGIGMITCDLHKGELKYKPDQFEWVCPGYDGEGCCQLTQTDMYSILYGRPLPEQCNALGVVWTTKGKTVTSIRVRVDASEVAKPSWQRINIEGSMSLWSRE